MKPFVAALILLTVSTPVFAQDAIDLHTATIVNAPDVRDWPATAQITAVSFDGATTRIHFTKEDGPDRWPDVTPPGWSGPLQYTVWLCLQTPAWSCSAFIQMWHGRDGSGSAADPDVPSVYDRHWYYAARWTPLYGHGPIQPGERIGLFVSSGNARDSVGPYSVRERSHVVVVAATDRGEVRVTPPASAPAEEVHPTPAPHTGGDETSDRPSTTTPQFTAISAALESVKVDLEHSREALAVLTHKVDDLTEQLAEHRAAVRSKWETASKFVVTRIVPALAAWWAGHQVATR